MTILEKTSKKSITIRFCLLPVYIDADYQEHLLQCMRDKYERKSIKEHGHVFKILCIEDILKEEIMSIVPNVFFKMRVSVLLYNPQIGDVLDMAIDKIFHHGIFLIEDTIRVMIPTGLCRDYTIQKDFSSYYLAPKTEGMKNLRRGDPLRIRLLEIRFEKDGFSCIGETTS